TSARTTRNDHLDGQDPNVVPTRRTDRDRRSSRRAGREGAGARVAVDGADEKLERLQRRQRAVVGVDARRRRVVLDGGGVVAAVASFGAADMGREIESESQARYARLAGQRSAIRLRLPQELPERGLLALTVAGASLGRGSGSGRRGR